ncbi:MAG: 2-amino-4-hydroxy-6-hydroxymethyldihydropteridine diphosphokinase [Gemmatimonadales bacterium]
MTLAVRACIALGSNLGDRAAALSLARERLMQLPDTTLVAASEVEETSPLGGLAQPSYLNQMVLLETSCSAAAVLEACHTIEREAGRTRDTPWCSRTLDLDLVYFGDVSCDLPDLVLPHPGLRDRNFWARQIAVVEAHG